MVGRSNIHFPARCSTCFITLNKHCLLLPDIPMSDQHSNFTGFHEMSNQRHLIMTAAKHMYRIARMFMVNLDHIKVAGSRTAAIFA